MVIFGFHVTSIQSVGCNAWCLLATNTVTRLARIIEYHRASVTSKKDHPKVGVNSCSFTTHRMLNTLWQTYKKPLKMAIEIVDLPIKDSDFP